MIDCEHLTPLYDEYALGVLEGEERAELEAHLARTCPNCVPGVAEARWRVAQLAHAAPEVNPPAALRKKIMATIEPSFRGTSAFTPIGGSSTKRDSLPIWAWIAAAALALITGYTIRQMSVQTSQLAELRREMKLATLQSQALQTQLELDRMITSVMMSPDSKPLKLMPKDKNMPMVHAFLHPHMGVAITADQMPSMPPDRTLQLWSVPKSGKPVSIAIFHPDAQGQIAVVAPVTMPLNEIAALAVTEEPAGGSPQPTSAIAWMAQVN